MGLLSLVSYLVHLSHSWQNGENDKGPSRDRKLNALNTESFLGAENDIAHNFAIHHGSWKYHRRFGKSDGIFIGTEFYFYTCQNMVCFLFQKR